LEFPVFATPTDVIVFALKKAQFLIHRFVDDLKPHEFEHQPCDGANCTAWILGHLALTDRRQLAWLGATNLPPLPAGFEERFLTTRTKAEQQAGYGDPKELIAAFDAHRDALIAFVPGVSAEKLAEPAPVARPMFSTCGEAVLFMALHVSMHAGQLSTIRRSLGYPPVS
jgi:uncharacterized damage-inducible protein DinB